MDGHDNDVDNTNNINNSPQGIFSTPELTVDAEKIAQSSEATTESSRAKIASIFANTETGKQAQRLNDAMAANTTPATEDIVLNNGPKKRSKWPIVLAAVALIAVIGGVAGYFVMNNLPGKAEEETPLIAFNNYLEYIERGPEEGWQEGQEIAEWYLFTLDEQDITSSERSEYLSNVRQKFNIAKDLLLESSDSVKELVPTYSESQNVLLLSLDLNNLAENLSGTYLKDGSKAAFDYLNSVIPRQDQDAINLTEVVRQNIYQYLQNRLNVLEAYSSHGCIKDGEIDLDCTASIVDNSTAINESELAQSEAIQMIDYNLPLLERYVKNLAIEIQDKLESSQNA